MAHLSYDDTPRLYVRLLKIIVTNKNRDCTHKIRQETQETTGLPKISVLLLWGLAAKSVPILRCN